ncbi:hypothetical protein HG536_0G04920 [Torulaspora globosa]|uniref:Uncharacterized protein n=1 Tax=Torulaspora globosa TaxID=48254 RepID=A0A7G3ZM94_9SACH|nr:uncharacterized protein HG536_0G04920 [Torulaspora globosa]QLL34630.1 hypothetical protein HG536_0G04920 [Torulaspora globosa]
MSKELLKMGSIAYQNFLESLKITRPIIQAPMAGVTSPKMVAEVCNNGALGSLPVSHINLKSSSGIAELRNLINEVKSYTRGTSLCRNVNLNFFCQEAILDISSAQKENWCSLYEKVSNIAIDRKEFVFEERSISFKEYEDGKAFQDLLAFFKDEYKPKVVSFHFGHPTKRSIRALQDLGIQVYVTATCEEEYQLLLELQVDGVICQGYEAGGHRGNFLQLSERFDEKLSTACLVKRIMRLPKTEHKKVPFIIPAGGLNTPTDVKYMLEIGASAVQIGTAFLGTTECKVSKKLHEILHEGKRPEPTLMISTVSGKSARAISSPFLRNLHSTYANEDLPDYGYMYNSFKKLRNLYPDKLNFMLAGQNYSSIETNLSIAELLTYLSESVECK